MGVYATPEIPGKRRRNFPEKSERTLEAMKMKKLNTLIYQGFEHGRECPDTSPMFKRGFGEVTRHFRPS